MTWSAARSTISNVLNGAEKRELAVKRLHAGETIPQMEGCLMLPGGRERTVLLGGQPIAIGDERCMLFTFADLHPRQQAQHALKHSEERFSKAIPHGGLARWRSWRSMAFCVADVNDAFTLVTGWSREEVLGREEAQLGLWGDTAACASIEKQIVADGHLHQVDVQLGGKTGSVGDFQLSVETTEIQGVSCVFSLMHDVSEHRQTETELLAACRVGDGGTRRGSANESSSVWQPSKVTVRRQVLHQKYRRYRSAYAVCSH